MAITLLNVPDLLGDIQEVQPVSNLSTAADLLKQGAGEAPHTPGSAQTTAFKCDRGILSQHAEDKATN